MYKSLETFCFRTPFFSFSTLPDFEIRQYDSVFKEMLQIASPDLSKSMEKGEEKAKYPIYRYYQRSCSRPTPFGLFAGCSIGNIGKHTKIQLLEQKKYKRITRLDMSYICALTQQIEKDRNIREQLLYYVNSSLYPVGDYLRYIEYYYQKTRRIYQIVQLENSEYLQKVLILTRDGMRFTELVTILVDDEISLEEATEFIHELIDSQVLISELEPAVTNVQPLTALIAKLKDLSKINNHFIDILTKIETQFVEIDKYPIGTTRDIYPAINNNIDKTKIKTDVKYLFQTDLFKPVQHAVVGRNIVKEIKQALLFLNKLTPTASLSNLSQFRENFVKRYDEQEIPLLFALDTEIGIGYANNTSGDFSPLVDELAMPFGNFPFNTPQTHIQSILMQKYQPSLQKIIELTDEDVKGVEIAWDNLPPTFSVMCQILQDDERGHSIYIKSVGTQSASNLLGRFCHLDEQILNHTLVITEKEAQMNPDVIFAEIVHLPESRIGNILLRPVLRQYEIPYLAKSSVSSQFELKPDDLYVSVKNNRILLRSKRLNREIVPRMCTAHNYSGQNSMPVYHFLCDMQYQAGFTGFGFYWNEVAQQSDYLPRVVYRNCILSQAQWTIREKEIKAFIGVKDDNELLLKIREWKRVRIIPDAVLLADGDNELYIDLNHPLSIRVWLSTVKKRPSFHLKEFLFNPAIAVVHGPEGVFNNEFIFAFYRESKKNAVI
jgi:hypothetical protein